MHRSGYSFSSLRSQADPMLVHSSAKAANFDKRIDSRDLQGTSKATQPTERIHPPAAMSHLPVVSAQIASARIQRTTTWNRQQNATWDIKACHRGGVGSIDQTRFDIAKACNKTSVLFKAHYKHLKKKWSDWSKDEIDAIWEDYLAEKLQREPTHYEEFKENHLKRRNKKQSQENEWVSDSAKKLTEDYESNLRALHPDSELPVNELRDPDFHAWKETIGGVRKGRLVGHPGEKWSKRSNSSCSIEYVSQETSRELQQLRTELALAKQREVNRDRIIAQQNEDLMFQYENTKIVNEKLGLPPPIQ